MKKISINELPRYSPWPARILNMEPFEQLVRDMNTIDMEYDKDKYARLLDYCKKAQHNLTVIDLKEYELSYLNEELYISREGQLYLATHREYITLENETIVKALSGPVAEVDVVVELGCGYGYNIAILDEAYPGRRWLGGEYSNNALKIAGLAHSGCRNISISRFNWYDDEWPIMGELDNIGGKALIFTKHTIEQFTYSKDVLTKITKYKNRIAGVMHLEPVYELAMGNTLLDMMRRQYTRIRGYNKDIISVLKSMDVKILDTQYDIIGGNALNPTSLVYWQF